MKFVSVRSIVLPLFRKRIASVSGLEHLPAQGPYLLAANHVDYLDGFYLSSAVHDVRRQAVYFLTKTSNYWWTRVTIPIDPNRRSDSLEDAFVHLRDGKIIGNFIEGERNFARHLLRGRTGTARLALESGVTVIPVGLNAKPSRNFLQSLTNVIADRAEASVAFGPPVDLSRFHDRPLDYGTLRAATDEIMRAIVPLTGKAYVS